MNAVRGTSYRRSMLSSKLVEQATRRWCDARRREQPCSPALQCLFAPHGLLMIAACFDSLMLLVEHAVGRPLLAGLAGEPTRDQRAIHALLVTGQLAAADAWLDSPTSRCQLARAIDCAAVSVRLAAAAREPTLIVG